MPEGQSRTTNYGTNRLYHNNGDGTFTDVAEAAGVTEPRWSTSCAFADYDRDGNLDLYVVNYIVFDITENPWCGLKEKGIRAYADGLSEEYPVYDFRKALESLGTITGETTVDDILDEIFSTFCIGK